MSNPKADHVFQFSTLALRDENEKWFMRGFACSGAKFHGETKVMNAAAFRRMMRVEFQRQWVNRDKDK